MRALLSVSDKSGIVEFAKSLKELGWEIVSTGGTCRELKSGGIDPIEVDEITKFPECFDGRVKTLNPHIHGGILYKRDKKSHQEEAKKLNITGIDLVCVNLYPFKETIYRTEDFEEIIENIDIGGPAMIRASAKNFKDVIVVTTPDDYKAVIKMLKDVGGEDREKSYEFRRDLMIKAFEHTANYDALIANYMNSRFKDNFGEQQFIVGKKVFNTRYGENPHQSGVLYQFEEFFSSHFKTIKGEASFNNLTDMDGAVKIASSFGEDKAVCIVKHGNPCGFAIKDTLLEAYSEALKCDPVSAFGGVVAVNGVVDETLAKKISEMFLEVVVAGDFTDGAIEIFKAKKRIKLFSHNSKTLIAPEDKIDFKHIQGGFVYQNSDCICDNEIRNAKLVSEHGATIQQMKDIEIAWKVVGATKSNSVVYVKNGAMVAVGMGMTSRVDASICALRKAREMGLDVKGSVMASEAFFPFRDSIDEASKAGVEVIVEPGGSIRDDEVIQAANEHNIALYFTGVRHFLH